MGESYLSTEGQSVYSTGQSTLWISVNILKLILLPGSLWSEVILTVVVPVKVLSMGQIDLFKIICIAYNRVQKYQNLRKSTKM